ncbi:MAG: TonB family protein [Opitutaceae bacterium]
MNKDIIVGVILSFLIHGFFLFGGYMFPAAPEEIKPAPPPPAVEIFKMPDLDPPKEEVVAEAEKPEQKPEKISPPKGQDMPSIIEPDKHIVQDLQPPSPPSVDNTLAFIPLDHGVGGKALTEIFREIDLDQVPQATYQQSPQYPYEAKRAGMSGSVEAGFIVDADGGVRDACVIRSSSPEFEDAALQAIRKWRFRPGVKAGRNVNTRMKQPFSFTLNGD